MSMCNKKACNLNTGYRGKRFEFQCLRLWLREAGEPTDGIPGLGRKRFPGEGREEGGGVLGMSKCWEQIVRAEETGQAGRI